MGRNNKYFITVKRNFLLFLIVLEIFLNPLTFVSAQKNTMSLVSPVPTSAAVIEYVLPYPGILPDHPLYFLKKIRDKILLTFTVDKMKKSQLNLLISDKHLVMGQIFWDREEYVKAIKTLYESENYLLDNLNKLIEIKKNSSLPPGLIEKNDTAVKKHKEVLTGFFLTPELKTDLKNQLEDIQKINNLANEKISSLKSL